MVRANCSLPENISSHRTHVNGVLPGLRMDIAMAAVMIRRFGEKVRRLREQAMMTQTELARQAGLNSRGYISDVESGKKIPPAERILTLAIIFHVTTDYLLRDDFDTPEDKANHP